MLQRQTRSCGHTENNNLEMPPKKVTKNHPVSLVDHNKLVQEKDALVKQIAELKEKFENALEKKKSLKLSIPNLKREADQKDIAIDKYNRKYLKNKDQNLEMKKTVRDLESNAEIDQSRIEALKKARQLSEEKKDQLQEELETHKEAFFLSKLKQEHLVFENSHQKRSYSHEYDAGRHPENTASRAYQPSKHRYYQDRQNENHHRR